MFCIFFSFFKGGDLLGEFEKKKKNLLTFAKFINPTLET